MWSRLWMCLDVGDFGSQGIKTSKGTTAPAAAGSSTRIEDRCLPHSVGGRLAKRGISAT